MVFFRLFYFIIPLVFLASSPQVFSSESDQNPEASEQCKRSMSATPVADQMSRNLLTDPEQMETVIKQLSDEELNYIFSIATEEMITQYSDEELNQILSTPIKKLNLPSDYIQDLKHLARQKNLWVIRGGSGSFPRL